MNDLIKALQIFLQYSDKQYPTHCEHDVLYIDVDYDIVSDKDKTLLDELGFIHDSENNTFKSYKFGSC